MATYAKSKPGSFGGREGQKVQRERPGKKERCPTACWAAVAWLMLPVMLTHPAPGDEVRLRRLDIAALAVLLLCNVSILLILRMKRKRAEKSLPWITWNEGRPAPSNDHTAANQALLQWGVVAAAGLLGASYSWITGQWLILPLFLAGGYWIGTRARGLLHH